MTKRKSAPAAPRQPRPCQLTQTKDETEAKTFARELLQPELRHGLTATQLTATYYTAEQSHAPELADFREVYEEAGAAAQRGDLAFASRMLAEQAVTLDRIFSETARRMALHMGSKLPVTEIYSRIALKAQANSRATLEALAKLHQPREQTVRHVHVNEGGQAVIADQFHHHQTGGPENDMRTEQPHATGAAGTSPALQSPDSFGDGVPVASGEECKAVPDAQW